MANYNKYDARLESLVVETATSWDPEIRDLEDADRAELAARLHQNPAAASKIRYERVHTGFVRRITVTPADIERISEPTAASPSTD